MAIPRARRPHRPSPATLAYVRQVEYTHPDDLRAVLPLIIPGETLYAVLPEQAQEPSTLAVTDRRRILGDQGQLGPQRQVVSLPCSKVARIAFAASEGTGFATSRLLVQAAPHR